MPDDLDESGPEPSSSFLRSLVDELVLQLLLVAAFLGAGWVATRALEYFGR